MRENTGCKKVTMKLREVEIKTSISLNTYIEHKVLSNMICLKLFYLEFGFYWLFYLEFGFYCVILYFC